MQADYCVLHRFLANSAVEKLAFPNSDLNPDYEFNTEGQELLPDGL
jgi:hypothetical protein